MKRILKILNPKNYTLATQLFLIMAVIIIFFIILQQIITQYLFGNYYIQRNFSIFKPSIDEYIDELNHSSNHFETISTFTSTNNAYSIIVNEDLTMAETPTATVITVNDLEFSLPNNAIIFTKNRTISIGHINQDVAFIIYDNTKYIFYESEQLTITNGEITTIHYPNNLNFIYNNYAIVKNELAYIRRPQNNLTNYSNHSYWYISNDENLYKAIVFLNQLNNDSYVLTIVPFQGSSNILSTLSAYNSYLYILIFLILVIISLYLSKFIASPIKEISLVADEIANLNFEVYANHYNNPETRKLSKSINTLSHNLKEVIDELNFKHKEISRFYSEQQAQFQMKKQLVSTISHELKTPLTIMQATICAILDGIFEADQFNDELNNVLYEINNTTSMIQDILDVYKMESETYSLEIERFNLSNLVSSTISSLEKVLLKYNRQIEFDNKESIFIKADKKQLQRVLNNVILNAIIYTRSDRPIEINLVKRSYILFEVINYGVNIPSNDINNVFEPFYRVDKSGNRKDNYGSGLGLYIVKEILLRHDFEFGITNINNGVKFYFHTKID